MVISQKGEIEKMFVDQKAPNITKTKNGKIVKRLNISYRYE